jgi:hypothetical protein
MYSILAAYVILIAYFAITESRRKGQAATTLKGGPFDQASRRLLSLAVVINIILLIVAPTLNHLQLGLTVDVIGWISIAVMLCGHTTDVGSSDARKVLHAHVAHIREPARRSRGAVQERASPRLSRSYPVMGRDRIGDRQLDCCGTRDTHRHRAVSLSH